MAVKTRAELKSENAGDFPDNTARLITAAHLRGQMDDVADSMLLDEDIAGLDLSEAEVTAAGGSTQTLAEWTADISGGVAGDFTQVGEGAITWPVTQRMQEQVYLLDFIPQAQHDTIRNDPNNTYDCSDALDAAIAAVTVPHQTGSGAVYVGGPEVIFPYGHCYFDRTIELKKTVTLSGHGTGEPTGYATRLIFKAGITGIVVNYLTTFEGGDVPGTKGANASIIRYFRISSKSGGAPFPDDVTNGYDYGLIGGYAEDHWIGHGIWARCACFIEHCLIQSFPRCGLYVVASSAGLAVGKPWIYGNANLFHAQHMACYSNGACGVYIDGADLNACVFIGINCVSNRLSGVYDSALIFNTHIGHHTDSNAVDGCCSFISGTPALSRRYLTLDDTRASGFAKPWTNSTSYVAGTYAANGGNLYRQTAAVGTSAASPATGPSGTGTNIVDNTCRWDYWAPVGTQIPPAGHAESEEVWNYIQNSPSGAATEPNDFFPHWPYHLDGVTPKRYRRAHPYWSPQASNSSIFLGCYTEASQPSSFNGGVVIGATTISTDSSATFIKGGGFIGDRFQINSRAGAPLPYATNIHQSLGDSLAWTAEGDNVVSWTWDNLQKAWGFQVGHAQKPMHITSNLSDPITAGRASPISYGSVVFGGRGIWLGSAVSTARQITNATVVPTTGQWAAGDVVLNSAPALGEPWGWRCIVTGDFAATPPVFQPLRDLGSQQTVATGAAITLTPGTSTYHTLYTGAIIVDRSATLSKTGALVGLSYKITRTATGAFNLNVLNGTGGPTLKALAVNTWGEFAFDGTDYYLAAYGSL